MGAFVPVGAQSVIVSDDQIQELLQAGDRFFDENDLSAALDRYERLLALYRQRHDVLGEATVLHRVGQVYHELSAPLAAAQAYERASELCDRITSPQATTLKADILYSWGRLSYEFAKTEQASVLLRQVIELSETSETSDIAPDTLGLAFYGLGLVAEDDADFLDAIGFYRRAYSAFGDGKLVEDQVNVLIAIGNIGSYLGDFAAATQSYRRALALNRDIDSPFRVSQVLENLGVVQARQENYAAALDFYQQALIIKKDTDNPRGMGQTLNNISNVYIHQGNFQRALLTLDQALIWVPPTDTGTRINIRDTFGSAYTGLSDYPSAWQSYHQALRLSAISGERRRGIVTTINLAQLALKRQQPLLAIAFYKQAINDIEQVRDNLRSQPLDTQQRYTETVADSYRDLATLLLNQNRVFEAQQVLDLLKIQELDSYLHDVQAEQPNIKEKLPYQPSERIILTQHRILLLEDQTDTDPVLSLDDFLNHPDVASALDQLGRSDEPPHQPESLQQLQQKLQDLPKKSAVLYPLVLDDRLELLLIPPTGAPIHQTTSIHKKHLTELVDQLRHSLVDPSNDVKDIAALLHEAIIRPLQPDLQHLQIKNIIYIPDSVLHYIPLSVLYDNHTNTWLVEHYTTHNLTASNIGDLNQAPRRPLSILAGAFADTNQTFEKFIDRKAVNFNGLTHAGHEVSFLKEQLPTSQVVYTQVLLNTDFSRNNLDTQLQGQNIVHLATHAAFVPGQPEESFILLGDGDTITLKDLRHWSLPNVDLVVLSACQTGISHIEDGLEILGMGFQVQRTEARAALASLWWVDDRSTSQLMELFYTELAAGNTKAQALQIAQRQIIARGRDEPYYWAPFVLIGNGL